MSDKSSFDSWLSIANPMSGKILVDGEDDDELFLWLTDERYLALFPARFIVRDSHHGEFLTRHKQDLNLHRTWVKAFLNEVVQQW